MTARDELAVTIEDALTLSRGIIAWTGAAQDDIADAILAAGYRKPRTIKSAAELEALPFGSAVQTSDAADVVVLRCEGRDFRNQSGYELSVETLWRYGTQPFTVIYEPDPKP